MPLEKAIAKAIFRKLVKQNLRPMQMIRIADKAGGSYRKKDMLEDIREMTGRHKYETSVRRLSGNQVIPKAYMQEVDGLAQPTKYKVQGYATFYDETTESYISHHVEFFTDDYAKNDDYSDAFFESFGQGYRDQDLDPIEFEWFGLQHDKNRDY